MFLGCSVVPALLHVPKRVRSLARSLKQRLQRRLKRPEQVTIYEINTSYAQMGEI